MKNSIIIFSPILFRFTYVLVVEIYSSIVNNASLYSLVLLKQTLNTYD